MLYILYLYTMFLYPNHFPNKYMWILSERSSFNTTPSSIFETPIVPWPMAMANGYVTPAVSQRSATSKVRTSGLWGFDLCDSFYLLMFENESGKDSNDISCQGVRERFPSYLLQRPDSPSFRQVSHFHLLGQHSTFYRFYQSFGTQIRRLQPDFALSIIHKKRRMEICQIPVLEERIPITFSLALKKRSRSQPCQMLGWKLLFR